MNTEEAKNLVENSENLETTFVGTRTSNLGVEETVGIEDEARNTHVLSVGPTGYGKTQVMVHAALQDAEKDRGFCFVNPKGETIDEILAKLPENREDDVVYINPAGDEAPAINVLEPHISSEASPEVIENHKEIIVSDVVDLFKRQSENWGDRFPRILKTLLRTHLDLNIRRGEQNSLMDVFRCVTDEDALTELIDRVEDPVSREELIRVKEDLGSYEMGPLQDRLNDFLENRVIRDVVASKTSGCNFYEAVNEGKIILVDVRKDQVGTEVAQLVGSIVITQVWAAAQARMNQHSQLDPYYLYVDELQNFGNEDSNLATILAEAREYNLGCWLATQYLSNLDSTEMRETVINNCRSLVVFNPKGSENENRIASLLNGVSKEHLSRLGKYRAAVQTPNEGEQGDAVVVDTLPPWTAEYDGIQGLKQRQAAGSSETSIELTPTTGSTTTTDQDVEEDAEEDEEQEAVGPSGGEKHDLLLAAAQEELQDRGFQVNVFYQEVGEEKPDGQVIMPDESNAHLEAEASSLSKPVKVLSNLKRGVEQGNEVIFVVEEGDEERLKNIVEDPVNRRGDEHEDGDGDSYSYYTDEDGDEFTEVEDLEDAEYRVLEIPREELEEGEESECPELRNYGREELESFCSYRDEDGFCSQLGKQCVFAESD